MRCLKGLQIPIVHFLLCPQVFMYGRSMHKEKQTNKSELCREKGVPALKHHDLT